MRFTTKKQLFVVNNNKKKGERCKGYVEMRMSSRQPTHTNANKLNWW